MLPPPAPLGGCPIPKYPAAVLNTCAVYIITRATGWMAGWLDGWHVSQLDEGAALHVAQQTFLHSVRACQRQGVAAAYCSSAHGQNFAICKVFARLAGFAYESATRASRTASFG